MSHFRGRGRRRCPLAQPLRPRTRHRGALQPYAFDPGRWLRADHEWAAASRLEAAGWDLLWWMAAPAPHAPVADLHVVGIHLLGPSPPSVGGAASGSGSAGHGRDDFL